MLRLEGARSHHAGHGPVRLQAGVADYWITRIFIQHPVARGNGGRVLPVCQRRGGQRHIIPVIPGWPDYSIRCLLVYCSPSHRRAGLDTSWSTAPKAALPRHRFVLRDSVRVHPRRRLCDAPVLAQGRQITICCQFGYPGRPAAGPRRSGYAGPPGRVIKSWLLWRCAARPQACVQSCEIGIASHVVQSVRRQTSPQFHWCGRR